MRRGAGDLRRGTRCAGNRRAGFALTDRSGAPRRTKMEDAMSAATVMINLGFGMGLALASALLLVI